jgi:hypothetical protein
MGDEGDVARDEPLAYRVGQRAADDEVYLEHSLGRQGRPAVGRVQQLFVEGLEMRGPQSPQPDASEAGQNVAVDLAAVAVPGAGAQGEALAGQPAGGQIRAEAE